MALSYTQLCIIIYVWEILSKLIDYPKITESIFFKTVKPFFFLSRHNYRKDAVSTFTPDALTLIVINKIMKWASIITLRAFHLYTLAVRTLMHSRRYEHKINYVVVEKVARAREYNRKWCAIYNRCRRRREKGRRRGGGGGDKELILWDQ